MKIKYEIERKIEGDNGNKSEKETTITFDDVPDVKKKVKGVGAFLAKKAKETAKIATGNVAVVTANVLDSVVDTAKTAVNADGMCCGECCCNETCEDEEDLADTIDGIINELEDEEEESDEEGVENDAESDSSDKPEENPVDIFIKGVIGDLGKISDDVIAFIKADNEEKAETLKKVEDYINCFGVNLANHLGIKIKKSEETSGEEEDAYEDDVEKVSDDSSNADEPAAEEIVPEKTFQEKIAEIPEGVNYSLREFLDYLGIYSCKEKTPDVVKEACIFFATVKYPATMYTRKAFENAITLEKVTYENVVKAIKDYFPDDSEDQILDHLHDEFDEWVAKANIKKYCPHINFRHLLMYFVSKVRGCE